MKKYLNFAFVFVLALSMLLINTSGTVSAKLNPVTSYIVPAEGAWSAGTEVFIDPATVKLPDLQLLTNGTVISEPQKICHEFRGGDYGWVGEIRMLKDGVWIKQTATTGWQPDSEGKFMICTDAATSGTFALFGYYDAKTAEGKHLPEVSTHRREV